MDPRVHPGRSEGALILREEDQSSPAPPGSPHLTLLLEEVPRDGAYNMALDQTLLDRSEQLGEGFLRLYRWAPHCLSFGRHEPALRRYDRSRIEAMGLDLVRRPTGGRAVWHARELTYAVAAPSAWFGSLPEAYCVIHRHLARGLALLGIPATLAPGRRAPQLGAGACFASPVGGELLVEGRKVAGSAQLRQGTALLQHGSLLLEDDQAVVAAVTRGQSPPSGEITLRAAAGRSVSFEEAARAIAHAFSGTLALTPAPSPRPAPEHLARFRDRQWTWRR